MNDVKKIVITGGPCGGKSTALDWINRYFTDIGYKVLFVPESATELITGGVTPWGCKDTLEYQTCQLYIQLEKEKVFERAASTMKTESGKVLIVCDRGVLDNKGFMTDDDFYKMVADLGRNEVELRDNYGAVFHLVTAAKGAEKFYTTANNPARTETPEQAAYFDERLLRAWTGHPHLRIIDNSTDFETKMQRLIKEICVYLGEPEPTETERRFLVEYPDVKYLESIDTCVRVEINQTYLIPEKEGVETRVRQRGINGNYVYFKTEKTKGAGVKREEKERSLKKEEYLELLMNADPERRPIRKTRYCIVYENQYFELDVYPFWNDKAILELELSDENAEIKFPPFLKIIREVTDEEEYRNSSLAKYKF